MTELSEKLEDRVAGVMQPLGAQQVEEGGVKLTGHRKNLAHSPSVNPSLKSNLRRQTVAALRSLSHWSVAYLGRLPLYIQHLLLDLVTY